MISRFRAIAGIELQRKNLTDLFSQVFGRGAWIRTRESRTQKPLPCRLATPLYFFLLVGTTGFEPAAS